MERQMNNIYLSVWYYTEHQMNSLFKTFASNLQDIADNKFMSKKCLKIV